MFPLEMTNTWKQIRTRMIVNFYRTFEQGDVTVGTLASVRENKSVGITFTVNNSRLPTMKQHRIIIILLISTFHIVLFHILHTMNINNIKLIKVKFLIFF